MISLGSLTSNNSNVILCLVKKKSFIYSFLHNLYTQPRAHTHDPEIKGCTLHGLRHPGIPRHLQFLNQHFKSLVMWPEHVQTIKPSKQHRQCSWKHTGKRKKKTEEKSNCQAIFTVVLSFYCHFFWEFSCLGLKIWFCFFFF